MTGGMFMAGGWWYCDCDGTRLQELEEKRAPTHEGDTNKCPRCGTVWIGKPVSATKIAADGGVEPVSDIYWWREERAQA